MNTVRGLNPRLGNANARDTSPDFALRNGLSKEQFEYIQHLARFIVDRAAAITLWGSALPMCYRWQMEFMSELDVTQHIAEIDALDEEIKKARAQLDVRLNGAAMPESQRLKSRQHDEKIREANVAYQYRRRKRIEAEAMAQLNTAVTPPEDLELNDFYRF